MADDASPFVFPTEGPLPHHDATAGIAFQNGATRGVYQAGILHGLVLSGYYPRTIGGTSVGSLSGAMLAFAAELDDQRRRMKLVDEYLAAWERDPAAAVLARLHDGPAGRLVGHLVDIDLPLGELFHLAGRFLGRSSPMGGLGKAWALLRLFWALPDELRGRIADAALAAFPGLLRGDGVGTIVLRAAQRVLDAYGLREALLDVGPIVPWFGHLIRDYGPRGEATTFDDLQRSDLVFQIANLSRGRRILTLGKRVDRPAPGTIAGGRLEAALTASSSFGPLCAPQRFGEIAAHLPKGFAADDLVMDAANIQKDALAPVLDRWIEADHAGDYRLFAAYHSPIGPTVAGGGSPFLGPALRSLELRDDLDLTYNADVMTLITGMLDELRAAGKAPPARPSGKGRYVPVRMSSIAPRRHLPVAGLSAPEPREMLEAAALGCRGALEALHDATIRRLGDGAPVACSLVLDTVRGEQQDPRRDEYFRPLPRLCEACDGELAPVYRPKRRASEDVGRANDFAPLHEPRELTVVVPAGGVGLGVFQFGSIAALSQYGVKPDLYAGASIGTIFSYLLQTTLRGGTLEPVVKLARKLPEWIDLGPEGTHLLDAVVDEVQARWSSDSVEMRGLRALRPRQVVDLFTPEELPEARRATWLTFQAGLGALLFTPMSRRGEPVRELGPEYGLLPGDRDELRRTVVNLARNRLAAVVAPDGGRPCPLDRIAANLDIYDPRAPDDGEVLGFHSFAEKLREVSFAGAGEAKMTLDQYSEEKEVRFVFTVTNHTHGMIEYLGYDDGVEPRLGSPRAVQAALAASSFPLAFRRRTRGEVFGPGCPDPQERYADGGIFNNFPSDTAFAYLRDLTDQEDTRWIGAERHRFLLLSLSFPPAAGAGDAERGLLATTMRGLSMGEDEKVDKTLRSQELLNALADVANPVLAEAGKRQTIKAEMELVSPAYTIYPHGFALKEYLGFTEAKELEMLASGCRRARISLEWGAYQDVNPRADLAALRARFRQELQDEVAGPHRPRDCVFGKFSPHRPDPIVCPFAHGEMGAVFETCKKTVQKELDVPDLKLSRRLYPRG